jgi:hypothetical protein
MKDSNYTSFIFSHIPKCGGTSFREFLYQSALNSDIDNERVYIPGYGGIKVNKNYNQLSKHELKVFSRQDFQLVAMHVPYGIHSEVQNLGSNPLYFSLFRDPLERFLSHYYFFYYRQGADGCRGKHLSDLSSHKRSKMISNLSNIYASYILGEVKSGIFHDVHLIKDIISKLDQSNYHYGLLSHVDIAISNLSSVLPNWLSLGEQFPNVNAHNFHDAYEDRLTDDLLDEFKSKNILDIKIYEYVKNSLSF